MSKINQTYRLDQPECSIWVGDEMDYDKIKLDDFEDNDIEKYNMIQSVGGDVTFGAGRNG